MALLSVIRLHWDRIGAWSAIITGGIVLITGWVGVSGTGYVFEQLPYIISGGIGGLFLLGLGGALLLSADLRDEWRKLDAIEEHLAHPASEEVPTKEEVIDRTPPAEQPEVAMRRSVRRKEPVQVRR